MNRVPGIHCYIGVVVAIALLGLVDRAISLRDKRISHSGYKSPRGNAFRSVYGKERRCAGRDAVALAPMKKMKPPFTDPRYDVIDPKVQRHGDVALLTCNLVNYGKLPDAPERVLARWNSTEVYSRIGGTWKIIHSHWSYIQPELKKTGS